VENLVFRDKRNHWNKTLKYEMIHLNVLSQKRDPIKAFLIKFAAEKPISSIMKTKILSSILASIFLLTIFSGCDLVNTDNEQNPIDHYLISYEKQKTYNPAFIKPILEALAGDSPEFAPILDRIEHEVTVYKITYITDFKGEELIASGLVCVPTSEGAFPVLSYQNGTNTLHSNAPSVNPDDQLFMLLEFISSTGFIITIPDYLGFGSTDDMFHPYLHKESTVQSIIDMQFATKELINNYLDIETNNDLYITGYSLGGWATLQLQKTIEDKFTNQFNLKASACGAGPYNLNYINDYVLAQTEYPMPYFVGYLFNSYINLGLTVPTNEIFQEPYDSRILDLYDGTNSGTAINDQLTTTVSELFTADFISSYNTNETYTPLVSMLSENSISAWKTTTPTMLLHGTNDTFVPPMGTNRIFQGFLSSGVGPNDVMMVPISGATHQSGIIPAGIAAVSWFLELRDAAEM
jgi:dienelactone hydrolase